MYVFLCQDKYIVFILTVITTERFEMIDKSGQKKFSSEINTLL